jgi:hypothetical protein
MSLTKEQNEGKRTRPNHSAELKAKVNSTYYLHPTNNLLMNRSYYENLIIIVCSYQYILNYNSLHSAIKLWLCHGNAQARYHVDGINNEPSKHGEYGSIDAENEQHHGKA